MLCPPKPLARELAALLSERDSQFRPDEHLTVRFARGKSTGAWWRGGNLEIVGGDGGEPGIGEG